MKTLLTLTGNIDPIMAALFLLSVICLAAILDRFLFWLCSGLRYRRIDTELFGPTEPGRRLLLQRLQNRRNLHFTEAVMVAGLQEPHSVSRLHQAAGEQIELMSRRLGTLDLIARIAPLVGILGTVVGMSRSFGGISAIVTASPDAISQGISLALRTTACGLVISLAATIAAVTFRKKIRQASLDMGRIICEFE